MERTMTEEDAFLASIREAPEDESPRIIFADWLDDHGDHERAEFIRVQILLSQLDRDSPSWEQTRKRSDEILARRRGEWTAGPPAQDVEFRRGFPDAVTLDVDAFLEWAEELAGSVPLRGSPEREVATGPGPTRPAPGSETAARA